MDALAVTNFRVVNSDFIPKFPYPGLWYEYFSGDSLLVEDINERITFLPGEYRLYTSQRIALPDDFVTSAKTFNRQTIDLYPNLVAAGQEIQLDLPVNPEKMEVRFFDSMGRQIEVLQTRIENQIVFSIPETLPNGIYLIHILSDHNLFTGKFIKQ